MVLTQEQRRQMQADPSARRRRGDPHKEERRSKDVMTRRNRGLESRDAKASSVDDAMPIDLRVEHSLRAKAELYDRIAKGDEPHSVGAGGLVDFAGKKRLRDVEAEEGLKDTGDLPDEGFNPSLFEAEYRERKELESLIQSSKQANMSAARVKTQWERTMSREAKSFLEEVRKETAAQEEGSNEVSRRKEARREKLLRMQQSQS